MTHRNFGARRRSGGFKGARRVAGIALAQLAITIGILAVFTAAAVSLAVNMVGDLDQNKAIEDNTQILVATANLRQRDPADPLPATAGYTTNTLRGMGAPAIFGTDTSAYGGAVAVNTTSYVYSYELDSAGRCESVRDALAIGVDNVTPNTTSTTVPTAQGTARGGREIQIFCDGATLWWAI